MVNQLPPIEIGALDQGVATNGTANTLNDYTKHWAANIWANYFVIIVQGTGAGQIKQISANTETSITVTSNWDTIPAGDSVYVIKNFATTTVSTQITSPVDASGNLKTDIGTTLHDYALASQITTLDTDLKANEPRFLVDSAGVNKAAVDASGNVSTKLGAAIPAGTNTIGAVKVVDSAGANQLGVNASGQTTTQIADSAGANKLSVDLNGNAQTNDNATDNNNGAFTQVAFLVLARARVVSAINTQTQIVVDIRNLLQILDIVMVTSAGTATLTVEVSSDNVNWLTVDSIAAAASTVKHYNNSTVGASTAVSPLAFRWVRITAGAAGAGNTTTLTIGAK